MWVRPHYRFEPDPFVEDLSPDWTNGPVTLADWLWSFALTSTSSREMEFAALLRDRCQPFSLSLTPFPCHLSTDRLRQQSPQQPPSVSFRACVMMEDEESDDRDAVFEGLSIVSVSIEEEVNLTLAIGVALEMPPSHAAAMS